MILVIPDYLETIAVYILVFFDSAILMVILYSVILAVATFPCDSNGCS